MGRLAPPRTCSTCERCTWNPGPNCERDEHYFCIVCGHCKGRHSGQGQKGGLFVKKGDEVTRFCPHPECEKTVSRHMLCCHEHWAELPSEWRMELGLMVGSGAILDAYIMAEFYWEGDDNGTIEDKESDGSE